MEPQAAPRPEPETPAPSPPPSAHRARGGRGWLVALAVGLAGALIARALLPLGLELAIPWVVAREIGLPARVGDVDLWVLRGAVALEDVVVGRASELDRGDDLADARALLRWQRLYVNLGWLALLDGQVRVESVELDAPRIHLERGPDGAIDPLPARDEEVPPAQPEPAGAPSEPWPLRVDQLALRGAEVEVADASGGRTLADFGLEELALRDFSLESGAIGLGALTIATPTLRVEREFVFRGGAAAETEPRSQPEPEPEPEGAAAAGPEHHLEHIELSSGVFTLATASGPLELELHARADDVRTRAGHRFPAEVELRIEDGELRLEGEVGIGPPAFEGRLVWRDLPLPPFSVISSPELVAWLRSCRASGDLDVLLAPGDPSSLALSGRAAVEDFRFADPEDRELSVAWDSFEIAIREARIPLGGAEPPRVVLERVRLASPELRFTRPPDQLDALLASLGPQGDETAAAEVVGAARGPLARVERLELTGGSLAFRDAGVRPAYEGRIRDLSVAASGLRWPEADARGVELRASGPGRARIRLDGGLREGSGALRFELARLALPPFDPYSSPLGYGLRSGELSLSSDVRVRGARYQLSNDVRLHDLGVDAEGDGFARTFGVPFDLALALLRGPGGDIAFSVPMAFDQGRLELGLTEIAANALRQALTGALASPLKMAGAALKVGRGGGISLDPLASPPGREELTAEAGARLDGFAELLAARPRLELALSGRAGPADRPALAEAILAERAAAGEPLPEVEGAGFLARRRIAGALRARARGESPELSPGDRALLERYVAATDVPETRLRALAAARAERARARLAAAGVDPARLHPADPELGADPGVRVRIEAEE